MAQERCPDPEAYERAQYMRALHSLAPPSSRDTLAQPWPLAGDAPP